VNNKELDLKDRAFDYVEQHEGWGTILSDSLTYELFRNDNFKDHICVDSKASRGLQVM